MKISRRFFEVWGNADSLPLTNGIGRLLLVWSSNHPLTSSGLTQALNVLTLLGCVEVRVVRIFGTFRRLWKVKTKPSNEPLGAKFADGKGAESLQGTPTLRW